MGGVATASEPASQPSATESIPAESAAAALASSLASRHGPAVSAASAAAAFTSTSKPAEPAVPAFSTAFSACPARTTPPTGLVSVATASGRLAADAAASPVSFWILRAVHLL